MGSCCIAARRLPAGRKISFVVLTTWKTSWLPRWYRYLAGAELNDLGPAIETFPGVEHRLEFVREIDGVEYYNDSKATNVDAALKAIVAFPGGLWMILGGKDKGSDYRPLARAAEEACQRRAVDRHGSAD